MCETHCVDMNVRHWNVLSELRHEPVKCILWNDLFLLVSAEIIRVFDGNASMKRRNYRTIAVPKNAPAQALLVNVFSEASE